MADRDALYLDLTPDDRELVSREIAKRDAPMTSVGLFELVENLSRPDVIAELRKQTLTP